MEKNTIEFKFRFLSMCNISSVHVSTEAGSIVTSDMMIDMITYCSKGDLDIAASALQWFKK